MRLNEINQSTQEHTKRELTRRDRPALVQAVERIFKWKCELRDVSSIAPGSTKKANMRWHLDIEVPRDLSQEDFRFTEGMIKRKLPSLVKQHLSDTAKPGEYRYMYPHMKALPGQKVELGLPQKIRVPIQ